MRRIVIDIDGTIAVSSGGDYANAVVCEDVVAQLREYKELGFEIVLFTSRNMRTHQNNFGKIIANTVPSIITWLQDHDIPFDEIWVGKPWCGEDGFYVDDRAIRPEEFTNLTYAEIMARLSSSGMQNADE